MPWSNIRLVLSIYRSENNPWELLITKRRKCKRIAAKAFTKLLKQGDKYPGHSKLPTWCDHHALSKDRLELFGC